MKRRRIGMVLASERRQADLFFADLMGLSPAPARVWPPAARPDVSVLEHPSFAEDFGEQQPRQTPSVSATTPEFPAKWVGVDRKNIPKRTAGGTAVADPAWMGTLIDNSNLRYTGAYVTGAPLPPPHDPAHFTKSSKDTAREWLPNVQALADQGWGVVFFYVGYSVGGGHPAPSTGVDRARGVLHGLHLRTTLHALGPQFAGATVFIDNEDSTDTTLPANLIEYYAGIFDEMSRPDPNLAAFRPALYGHGRPVGQLLARRRDLFVWDPWIDTDTTTTSVAPFTANVDPITVDAASRKIRAYEATAGGQRFITWPLGRQFRFYTGEMPSDRSAVARRLSGWRRETSWDYNTSFVRNAAFPAAEPRIAAHSYVATALVVADLFQPRTPGATPTPPASRVVTPSASGAVVIPAAAGITVEPDAPLTLFFRGGEVLLATVLSGGGIGVAAYNGVIGTWGAIDRIAGAVPALRRSRALLGVTNTASNAHLFFIGSDNRLYIKRQTKPGNTWTAWTDGQPVTDDLRVHPFSSLAGVARRGDWVETFVIDEQGRLASAWWSHRFTAPFPGFRVQRLETTPSLLPGGGLAAVCPHPDHLLVFGVGNDQRLRFTAFVAGQGWTALAAVGAAQDLVGAHTRLAAHAVSGSEVEVAALTDSGSLAVYPFRLTRTTWTAAARQVVADPPAAGAGAPPAGSAAGFRINPFGDLAIIRPARQPSSTVYCAGLRGSDARTLRWNSSATQPWVPFAN